MNDLTPNHFRRLPPLAAERLGLLRDLHDRLWDAAHGAYGRMQEAREERMHFAAVFTRIERETSDGYRSADDRDLLLAKRQLEDAQAEVARAAAAHAASNDRKAPAQTALAAAAEWISDLPADATPKIVTPKVAPARKGETPDQAVERIRARLAELQDGLTQARRAPRLAKEVIADLHRQIDQTADAGEPNVVDCIELRRPLAWPQTSSWAGIAGSANPAFATGPDVLAILVWLCRDQMKERLAQLVARDADDAAALGDEDRKRQEQALVDEILSVERQEAEFLVAAWRDGFEALPRADMDPRALLGLDIGR